MAIETDNSLFAFGIVSLSNPPGLGRQNGFVEGTLTRVSTGVFRLQTVVPIDTDDGVCSMTPAAGSAVVVSAQIQSLASDGPNNIILYGYNLAGDPADVGGCYLTIHRFPTT